MSRYRLSALPVLLSFLCLSGQGFAANAAFQDFFFSVCSGASGDLATRCGETNGGLGDLSGDSESSLNPSQTLGLPASGRAANANRSSDARDQGFELRNGVDGAEATWVQGKLSLLFNARTSTEEFDRRIDLDAERGYDLDASALQLGLDYRVSGSLVLGGWINWEAQELDFVRELPGVNFAPSGQAGTIDRDALGLTAFISGTAGERFFYDLAVGYSSDDYDLTRNALFQESNRSVPTTAVRTSATTDGTELWFGGTVGLGLTSGAWQWEPYASLTLTRQKIDGYQERDASGSGLALAVEDQEADSTLATLGLRLATTISGSGFVFIPSLRVEASQQLDDDPTESRVRFLADSNNTRFALEGDDPEDSFGNIGLGAVALFPNGLSLFLEYQSLVGAGDLDRWAISGGLRVEL